MAADSSPCTLDVSRSCPDDPEHQPADHRLRPFAQNSRDACLGWHATASCSSHGIHGASGCRLFGYLESPRRRCARRRRRIGLGRFRRCAGRAHRHHRHRPGQGHQHLRAQTYLWRERRLVRTHRADARSAGEGPSRGQPLHPLSRRRLGRRLPLERKRRLRRRSSVGSQPSDIPPRFLGLSPLPRNHVELRPAKPRHRWRALHPLAFEPRHRVPGSAMASRGSWRPEGRGLGGDRLGHAVRHLLSDPGFQ
jgi:hypothetical protein